jgi:hypothetical protein
MTPKDGGTDCLNRAAGTIKIDGENMANVGSDRTPAHRQMVRFDAIWSSASMSMSVSKISPITAATALVTPLPP